MNSSIASVRHIRWRRLLAVAASWLVLWPLTLAHGQCNPVLQPPGSIFELEPNDFPPMAQEWPMGVAVYGNQGSMGDSDFFRLEGIPPDASVRFTVIPDTFNPMLRVWALQGGLFVVLAEADLTGWCQPEQVLTIGLDPCQPFVPREALLLEVSQSMLQPPQSGHYLATATVVANTVPQGDCWMFPLNVGAFPYTDTQNTAVGFRDQGFNASADVWYKLVLDQGGMLTAQTCAMATNFNTSLWVIDDDGATVLASNDDSPLCGVGSTKSRLSTLLDAGTCYVVVEGAGAAAGTYQLDLGFLTCNAVMPGPDFLPELEPNDHWTMAQPWPLSMQLYGEQTLMGDSDFYRVMGLAAYDGLQVMIEPDMFDPVVRIYALEVEGPVLVAESDAGGFCEVESVSVAGWDPCTQSNPHVEWLVEVCQSPTGTPMSGHYLGAMMVIASDVVQGDCSQYPIPVAMLPFTNSQNTSLLFRDMGFNESADVWYRLEIDQTGILIAETCDQTTDFNTCLRLLDADGATVLASNDDSGVCGLGSQRSWLSHCLTEGTYYVMVEGGGADTGNFTLNLSWATTVNMATLIAGEWGPQAEEWHQRYTPETSTLRLLVEDTCGEIERVDFLGSVEGFPPIMLGTDLDGHESRVATMPLPDPPGDGWFLDFDPWLLRPDPGPVEFIALLHFVDGAIEEVRLQSWFSPNLSETALMEELEYWEVIHDDHITLIPIAQPGPLNLTLSYKLGEKVPEWSRAVPFESQRPISDSHCVPTAIAACLEWLDETYDTNVCGGLSGDELIQALGTYMDTNVGEPGTDVSDARSGLQRWINENGNGYTVHVQDQGEMDDMQGQAEHQGQDEIVILWWANGGGHAVTLSSFMNVPNADGTFTVDFMDPWTGTTQEGNFDPNTGQFSGYGDNNASGTMGQVIYVCPIEQGPGGGGGSGGGGGTGPFQVPFDVPVPPGLWWLKTTFLDGFGKAADLWNIVERRTPQEPQVIIHLVPNNVAVRLTWDPVPDAVGYNIYRNMDGFFNPEGDVPYATVTDTTFVDPILSLSARWCYKVTTVYLK